ncbi:MAG: DUF4156 domain-containing protein [Mariprofundaceae bacterium]
MKHLWIVGLLIFVSACTWVKPTARGDMVRVATVSQVSACEKVGETKTSVLAKVGPLDRGQATVEAELTTLARTSAADMGGDTVVPLGGVVGGERAFAVYKCGDR